jgi:hypothetical protein
LVHAHDTGDVGSNHKAMHSTGGGGAQLTTRRGMVGPARKGGSNEGLQGRKGAARKGCSDEGPTAVTRSSMVHQGRVALARCGIGGS